LYASATVLALIGFALVNPNTPETSKVLIVGLCSLLFVASGGVIAMVSPYTAEIYPTRLRGTGSGVSAGSSKLGGLAGAVGLVTGAFGVATGILTSALIVAVPMALAAAVIAAKGMETRGKRLEDISDEELEAVR